MGAILLVDIGNTSVALAVARGRRTGRPLRVGTADEGRAGAASAVRRVLGQVRVEGAVLSSVVPARTGVWRHAISTEAGVRPLLVAHALCFGFRIDYPRPETIGADRLVNACAAVARYGTPVVAIDAGTATTFDVVDRRGCFIGGIIVPGPRLMLDYLADRTALLPRLGLPPAVKGIVGRSTREAMEFGARAGYTGLVKEIVARLGRKLGRGARFCATGGDGGWAVDGLGITYEPDLTFQGLAAIWQLNRNTAGD